MSHSSWPRALLFDLAHNNAVVSIIRGWLHCLTPESIVRFLANNILMFDLAWCLVMAQIQISLIKKNKDGHLEHSLPPYHWQLLIFTLAPSPSPFRGRDMCIIPKALVTFSKLSIIHNLTGRKISYIVWFLKYRWVQTCFVFHTNDLKHIMTVR